MAKLKNVKVVITLDALSQVAQTGIRYGWKARDTICHDRYCVKCGRKDHHAAPVIPKDTKVKLAEKIAADILREFEKQAAQRRFLRGSSPIIFDGRGMPYDGPEEPN